LRKTIATRSKLKEANCKFEASPVLPFGGDVVLEVPEGAREFRGARTGVVENGAIVEPPVAGVAVEPPVEGAVVEPPVAGVVVEEVVAGAFAGATTGVSVGTPAGCVVTGVSVGTPAGCCAGATAGCWVDVTAGC